MNRDYTLMWWRDGFNRGLQQMNFRTGYYGMAFDNISGGLCRFGGVDALSEAEAVKAPNSDIDALPEIKMQLSAFSHGVEHICSGISQIDKWGAHSRIIEMGHCTDRMDAMYYNFEGLDIKGRCELAAFPRFASLAVSGFCHNEVKDLAFCVRLELKLEHVRTTPTTVIFKGLTVLMHNCRAWYENGVLLLKGNGADLPKNVFSAGFSVDLLPQTTAKAFMEDIKGVQVSARDMKTGEQLPVERSDNGAAYIITTELTGNLDFSVEENRRYFERVRITLKNNSSQEVLLPVCFFKDKKLFPTSGVCPILRQVDGEPCGIQVQLSKNWHHMSTDKKNDFYAPADDPKRYLEGPWLHAWSNIPLAPGELVLEYNCLYASWGTVWSASHSQLCLAGWGGAYQLWESSAIGSFGEAFCYDAETSHGRAFIDDIRPLTVYTKNDVKQKQYQWTGCNGGGNFLMYFDKTGAQIPIVNMRVWFKKQGPNLCEVVYWGETADGAVSCCFKANLPRTDDCSRAIHTFSYTFNKDVEFSRLALYQLGADHYNDNDYPRICIGNNDGPIAFELDGVKYGGEFGAPDCDSPGYPGGAQQPIEVPGEGLFIACLGAQMTNTNGCKFGPVANRTLVLRSFSAEINGEKCLKPAVSLYRTMDFGVSCMAEELCLPARYKTVKAGSVIKGVVEYLNLPIKKEYYYGTSRIMAGFTAEEFDSWRLASRYNKQGRIRAKMITGELAQDYPVEVMCAGDSAELVLLGGLSYASVTFKGLSNCYGYKLYMWNGKDFEAIDQSDNGSDFKQCYRGEEGWELTFNVELDGTECRIKLSRG